MWHFSSMPHATSYNCFIYYLAWNDCCSRSFHTALMLYILPIWLGHIAPLCNTNSKKKNVFWLGVLVEWVPQHSKIIL